MCKTYNITFFCEHSDPAFQPCEWFEQGWGKRRHPCAQKEVNGTDLSRNCPDCLHQRKKRHKIRMNNQGLSPFDFGLIQVWDQDRLRTNDVTILRILRNEAYLRRRWLRNRKAWPLPAPRAEFNEIAELPITNGELRTEIMDNKNGGIVLVYSPPDPTDLELQFLVNEEFLARRRKDRSSRKFREGGFFSQELRAITKHDTQAYIEAGENLEAFRGAIALSLKPDEAPPIEGTRTGRGTASHRAHRSQTKSDSDDEETVEGSSASIAETPPLENDESDSDSDSWDSELEEKMRERFYRLTSDISDGDGNATPARPVSRLGNYDQRGGLHSFSTIDDDDVSSPDDSIEECKLTFFDDDGLQVEEILTRSQFSRQESEKRSQSSLDHHKSEEETADAGPDAKIGASSSTEKSNDENEEGNEEIVVERGRKRRRSLDRHWRPVRTANQGTPAILSPGGSLAPGGNARSELSSTSSTEIAPNKQSETTVAWTFNVAFRPAPRRKSPAEETIAEQNPERALILAPREPALQVSPVDESSSEDDDLFKPSRPAPRPPTEGKESLTHDDAGLWPFDPSPNSIMPDSSFGVDMMNSIRRFFGKDESMDPHRLHDWIVNTRWAYEILEFGRRFYYFAEGRKNAKEQERFRRMEWMDGIRSSDPKYSEDLCQAQRAWACLRWDEVRSSSESGNDVDTNNDLQRLEMSGSTYFEQWLSVFEPDSDDEDSDEPTNAGNATFVEASQVPSNQTFEIRRTSRRLSWSRQNPLFNFEPMKFPSGLRTEVVMVERDDVHPSEVPLPVDDGDEWFKLADSYEPEMDNELFSYKSETGQALLSTIKRLLDLPSAMSPQRVSLYIDENEEMMQALREGRLYLPILQPPNVSPPSPEDLWLLLEAIRQVDWMEIDEEPLSVSP